MTVTLDGSGRPQLITDGQPAVNGFLANTCHPKDATTAVAITAAGVLTVLRLVMQTEAGPSSIATNLTAAGTGLTAGQCFAGLYDRNGNQIGVTADQSTNWTTTGVKAMALTAEAPPQPAGDPVYVALLWNGTTGPTLRGPSGNGVCNWGLSGGLFRFASQGSALTALPASLTLSSLAGFGATVPFVGLT